MTNTENGVKQLPRAQMADEDTIDLLELFLVLLRRWKLIVCVMILCASAAGLYNYFCIDPMYQASSRIYISNTNTVINIQELQLSDELAADYEQIFLSRTVLKKVISKLELNMTYKELGNIISISTPKDSHCLDISVTCSEPGIAVEITNCLVRTGIDQVYRIVGHEEPSVIDPAESDAVTVIKPSLAKFVLLGAMLGALVVCGITAALSLLDNTLKTEEDIERHMGLPVLASVPVSEAEELKKKQKGRHHNGRKKG